MFAAALADNQREASKMTELYKKYSDCLPMQSDATRI